MAIVIDRLFETGPVDLVDAETGWRRGVSPGEDISDLSAEIQDAILAHWTPERVANYQASMPVPEEVVQPDQGLTPPRMIASAFGITVADGDISNIVKAYNLVAALYLDVGQYMLLFLQAEPDADYFALPVSTGSMQVVEQGVDYLILEARDAAGALFDPAQFSVQVFRI